MAMDSWVAAVIGVGVPRRGGLFMAVAVGVALSACGGGYGGSPGGSPGGTSGNNSTGTTAGSGTSFASTQEFFNARVEPNLGFCRTCHVPGGVADTDKGKRFMLSSNSAEDYSKLQTAWQTLGKGVETNRILLKPSGQDPEPHSGGTPWPKDSAQYNDMKTLLSCWDNPAGCAALLTGVGGGTVTPQLPLLGSAHAKTLWASYCEGKPDDAALPPDPRTLIRPGVNQGKAVFYNAYWEDCHLATVFPPEKQHPKTCGAYRARRDRGKALMLGGMAVGGIAAADYNNTWQKWGLSERPQNFDEMYRLRYGRNPAPFHNPYPVPASSGALEDPNQTQGGSGELPLGLVQLKDADGRWKGQIGSIACLSCHGGQIGSREGPNGSDLMSLANLGVGNSNLDSIIDGHDNGATAVSGLTGVTLPSVPGAPALPLPDLLNVGVKQRGQNNAVGGFELLFMLEDYDSLDLSPNPLKSTVATGLSDASHPTAEAQDTPAWWNVGHRPRKFFDAGQSSDGTRIIMAAGGGVDGSSQFGKGYRDVIDAHDQELEAFFLSLESPKYPGHIDTQLAEQGAVLFHTKNLWAAAGNADRPKPLGGNGSCASCHGAYSPRYVNDKQYLENPVLEGVAGHISPLDVIGTDRARADHLSPALRKIYGTTFWGFPDGVAGWVSPDQKDPVTEKADDLMPNRPQGVCGWEQDVIGYQAPPLYGTWATAPYLHNGSVPTIEQVLDSSKRPPIWRRQLQVEGPVTGFDQRLSNSYDFDRLGWKYEVLSCEQMPGTQAMNCNPADSTQPSPTELLENVLKQNLNWLALLSIPDPAPDAIDKRLIYDTRILGNGNAGHTFTGVLTDPERRAIIEYLKTL